MENLNGSIFHYNKDLALWFRRDYADGKLVGMGTAEKREVLEDGYVARLAA